MNRGLIVLFIAVVCVVAQCFLASVSHAQDDKANLRKLHLESEKNILVALSKRVNFEVYDEPLAKTLRSIGKLGNFPLIVDRAAFAEEELSLDEPVTIAAKNAPLETLLYRIGQQYELTWYIDRGVMTVTAEIDNDEVLFTRVFKLKELMETVTKESQHRSHLEPLGSSNCFGPNAPLPMRKTTKLDVLFQILVDGTPGPWVDDEGTGGTISRVGDSLIVRQTYSLLRDVEATLEALNNSIDDDLNEVEIPVVSKNYPLQDDLKIQTQLSKKFDYDFHETDLKDALAIFGEQLNASLILDELQFEEHEIPTNSKVSLVANDLTIDSALAHALSPVGLKHYINRGAVVVTPQAAWDGRTVVYQIRDLCQRGLNGQHIYDTILQETPGPWVLDHGTGGTITKFLNRAIVVRADSQSHRQVRQILDKIRASTAALKVNAAKKVTKSYSLRRFAKQFRKTDKLNRDPIDEAIVAIDGNLSMSDSVRIQAVGDVLIVKAPETEQLKIATFIDAHLKSKRKKP